jgi:hypothetical protein
MSVSAQHQKQGRNSSAQNLLQKPKEVLLYIHGVYVIPGRIYKRLDNLGVGNMRIVCGGNRILMPTLCPFFVVNGLFFRRLRFTLKWLAEYRIGQKK